MAPNKQCLRDLAVDWLARRGVQLEDIAQLVFELQQVYIPHITMEVCLHNVEKVMNKREVQNAVFTGLSLDELGEKGLLDEPLLSMLRDDDGLYGIDEIVALSIVNIYGTIGLTNFGYLDKIKSGVVGTLNLEKQPRVNTFIDDLVAAIAAAAAARVAHQSRDQGGSLTNVVPDQIPNAPDDNPQG